MSEPPPPHVRVGHVTGPILRALRRLAAGGSHRTAEEPQPNARGRDWTLYRILTLNLAAVRRTNGEMEYELIVLGREAIVTPKTVP